MRKLNKKLLSASLVLAPLATLPIIAVACKNNSNSNNSGYQKSLIKKQLTQNQVMLDLTSGILNQIYNEDVSKYATSAQTNPKDRVKEALLNSSSELWKDFLKIFKVYARKKLATDWQFFSKLRNIFAELKIDVTSFSPAPNNVPTDEQLKFILQNADVLNTNIRLDIEKLLVIYNYLIKSRTELKNIANDSDGEDKVKKALKTDKKSMTDTQKELHNALNWKGDDLYLIEALMNDPIVQSWNFTDNRNIELRWTQGRIRTAKQYNDLADYNPDEAPQYKHNDPVQEWEKESTLLSTGIKENNKDIGETLKAYKGVIKNSGFSGRDMETSISAIKDQKSPIFGFIDPTTNKIYGPNEFAFGDLMEVMKKRPIAKIKDEYIDGVKNGTIKKIENKHLTLQYWSETANKFEDATFKDDKFKAKFKIKKVDENGKPTTEEDEITVTYEVNRIKHDSNKIGDVVVEWKLSTDKLGKRNYYEFQTRLKSDNNKWEDEHKDNPLEMPLSQFPKTVNLVKDQKEFVGKFVSKISPLYSEISKDVKKLTLDGTPWSDAEQKSRIAYNIMFLNEKDYFKKAMLYYKELKLYSINETNLHTEIRDMLRQIGIL